jgi:serine/threonine-protein kinase
VSTTDPFVAAGVREGEILVGKYRVERVLGVGGMGAVVSAHHLQLDTKVAMKFVLPANVEDADVIARFTNEGRRAVKITSEHVARVFDVGMLENGAPYIVMEYLRGNDLSKELARRGPLPIDDAIDYVLQAMEAIAEAHTLGIVHRDLKPANLFCIQRADGKPFIKVLDFGIAKALPTDSSPGLALTVTSAMMGTPFYMSPEQMVGTHAVDIRTDIWALGIILFELLTGRVPFHGTTVPEVCAKIASLEPPPLRSLRGDASEGLERVIATCLSKHREGRFRSAADLAAALVPFAPQRAMGSAGKIADVWAGVAGSIVPVPLKEVAAIPALRTETIAPLGRTTPPPNKRKAITGAVAGLTLVAVAGAAAALVFRSGDVHGGDAEATVGAADAALTPSGAGEPSVRVASPRNEVAAAVENEIGAAKTLSASPSTEVAPPEEASAATASARAPIAPVTTLGKPRTTPVTGPRAKPATAGKPGCDPNYTLDEQGRKRFKPECFTK